MKKIFFLVFVIFSLNTLTSFAVTNIPAGLVSGTWTTSGSPYNIQGNIQISNGTTLTIEPGVSVIFQGTYKLNVKGRLLAIGTETDSITFVSADTINGWRGIRYVNTLVTNDTSIIKYCNIAYSWAFAGSSTDASGGALYFENFSKAIISNCLISNCKADYYGGAIYCLGSSPTIKNNTIVNNVIPNTSSNGAGGGIYCDNGSNPTISFNTISYNSVPSYLCYGGGIMCNSSSPTISNNTISNNSACFGGGIVCNNSNSLITNNTISFNTATANPNGNGSGIYCSGSGAPSILNNTITNNNAANGGGICSYGSNSIISNNIITYNTATNGSGGGICCFQWGNQTITNNIISNNTAAQGGGISCDGSSVIISNNTITNNTSTSFGTEYGGGGIYCSGSNPIFSNNTIANNSAVVGGALYCFNAANPVFRNCIFRGNTASANGTQVFIYDDTNSPDFFYCDLQGDSTAFELNGYIYSGTYQNNLDVDPLFVAPSGGSGTGYNGVIADWSLQNSSPCIDAGDPNGSYTSIDLAGLPRVNVCRIDMGAYEYQTGIPFDVSLSISQPIICNGVSTGEIEAIVSGGTLPYSYLWSNGQTTDTAIGLIAGTYTVTVSTASYGCAIIDSIMLNAPVLISVDAGSDLAFICGDSAQLGCVISPSGNPTLTYQWLPSIGLNNDTIPNPKALVTGNIKYIVTVTTPNGCIAIDSVNVTSSLSISGNDITVNCGDNNTTLYTTTNYTGTDTLTYTWLPVAGLDNPNIANPIATIDSNQTYTVTVTTPNGCSATNSIHVLVNSLTINGTNINISCGDNILLSTATNYTGTGTLTYAWSPSAGLSDTTIANPYVTGISNQQYTVLVTTPNGCEATDIVSVSLSPMANPDVCIVGVDTSNKNLVIWNKPLSGAIDSFYVYKETGTTNVYNRIGSVSYDSLSVFVDNASQPDVQSNKYKISILDKCGLETTLSDYHKTMHLSINQGMGNKWNLDWEPYEGFTVSSYKIYRGTSPDTLLQIGTVLGGGTQYTDLTPPTGYIYYQVEVVSPNSCNLTKSYNTSRSNIASNNPNGITNYTSASQLFSIYPNPANDIIEVEIIQKSLPKGINLEILNTTGQVIKNINLNDNRTSIDISGFANGMYFIKIQSDNEVFVKKFVKE